MSRQGFLISVITVGFKHSMDEGNTMAIPAVGACILAATRLHLFITHAKHVRQKSCAAVARFSSMGIYLRSTLVGCAAVCRSLANPWP